jgi:V-type H+-transporting ATPase subunit d
VRIQAYSPHIKPYHELSDFRTQLSATDYSNFLANEPLPISTSTIADKATQILVDQFNYLRSNAVEPLSKFLDYITSVLSLSQVIHVLTAEIQLRVYD